MIALAQQSNILDEVIHGSALDVLRSMPDNSVDAIVCDPPAGISFMNKTFDSDRGGRDFWIAWLRAIMAEALRVLKPGGHAFVWSLPRTSHWTGMALEDAGFEIRDMVTHLFGSGFPKSMDVSKAIDKMQCAEREVIGVSSITGKRHQRSTIDDGNGYTPGRVFQNTDTVTNHITAPATPEASQWNGWGTSLKPASEHWWLCRKPLSEKSIAANVLKWGTGAINIDATRIKTQSGESFYRPAVHTGEHEGYDRPCKHDPAWIAQRQITKDKAAVAANTQGRFPANLLLSHSVWCVPNGVKKVKGNGGGWNGLGNTHNESQWRLNNPDGINRQNSEGMEQVEDWLCDESCPIRLLDEQSGMRKSGSKERMTTIGYGQDSNHTFDRVVNHEASEGGASRYFQRFSPFIYQAKASRSERNSGCEGLPSRNTHRYSAGVGRNDTPTSDPNRPVIESNTHPTVKSLALMRYLVRLITPPGGIVLDCFAGSGSTLVAAIHEGMHFIGIEQLDTPEEPYCTIARARIEQAFREVQS